MTTDRRPGEPIPEQAQLIKAAYAAFNRRDIDGALAAMTADVEWPNGWEGGVVSGHDEVRSYWTRQWAELDPTVVPATMRELEDGRVAVTVDQHVRQPDGAVVAAGEVGHVYTFRDGLVARMEIVEAP